MVQNDIKRVIKDTVDITDFISQYTSLVPSGTRMKGLSPFTNEKTPSFFVNPEEGFYYCFSSQKGGDIFSFVQEMEGVDFRGALRIVAEYAGIEMSASSRFTTKDTKSSLYHALETAQVVYRKNIPSEVKQYLLSRGITEESVNRWGIGYAPDSWNTICHKGMVSCKDYVDSGLCIQKDDSVYDRFRGRILFPFYDLRGRIIGFSGRAFADETGAKYINSPETPLFKKSEFLYGMHRAKPVIRKNNVAMLVEGPIDAVMAHQTGYEFAVATSGTAVTVEHLQQIQRLTRRLIVAFDSDSAGVRATLRVLAMCLSVDIDVKVILLPDGVDPADILVKEPDVFKERVRCALSAFEYLFSHVRDVYGEKSEDVVRGVREKVIPVILATQNSMLRGSAIRDAAAFCSLSEDKILESMREYCISVKGAQRYRSHGQGGVRRGEGVVADVGAERRVTVLRDKETREEKMRKLFFVVGTGRVYLTEHSVSIRPETEKMFQEIVLLQAVPEVQCDLAKMRYDVDFPDKASRHEKVLTMFSDSVKLLRAELLKKKERDKVNRSQLSLSASD